MHSYFGGLSPRSTGWLKAFLLFVRKPFSARSPHVVLTDDAPAFFERVTTGGDEIEHLLQRLPLPFC
jgi:hypothetical protein